jgi:hypothetical protein
MSEETPPKPQIIEAFHGYNPPFDAAKIVRRMLRVVPPQFLHGLNSIVLTNVAALSRQERERRTRGRDRRVTLGEARGYYSHAWKGEPARITILVDNFEKRFGRSWLRVGIVRDLDFSELLFHELGHHIHRLHRPEYEGRENVADKWSKRLSTRYLRSRYWYLIPLIVPLSLLFDLGKGIAGKYRSIRAKT